MKKTPETQNKAKLEAAKAALKAAEEALAAERVKLTEFERPYAKQSALVEGAETAVTNAEAQLRQERSNQLLTLLRQQPDLVDLLTPQHTRRCSDTVREEKLCARCFLIESKEYSFMDDSVVWEFVVR